MIYIHLGFPKTGTTYLQKKIFPFIKDINYLGKDYRNKKKIFEDLHNYIEKRKKFSKKKINQIANKLQNMSRKQSILISEENWMNAFNRNKFSKRFEIVPQEEKLKNLRTVISLAKVEYKIFILQRNLETSLQSFYVTANYLISKCLGAKYISFNFFLSQIFFNKLKKKKYLLLFNTFNLNLIKSYFPKKNIKVFQYQNLRDNTEKFQKQLFKFLKIKSNKKYFINNYMRKTVKIKNNYYIKIPRVHTKILRKIFTRIESIKIFNNRFFYSIEILNFVLLKKVIKKLKNQKIVIK